MSVTCECFVIVKLWFRIQIFLIYVMQVPGCWEDQNCEESPGDAGVLQTSSRTLWYIAMVFGWRLEIVGCLPLLIDWVDSLKLNHNSAMNTEIKSLWSNLVIFSQDDENEWRERLAKSKTKSNFVALVSTADVKSKRFKMAFDSRNFLKWKVMARVKAWCRASSWVWSWVSFQGMWKLKSCWYIQHILDVVLWGKKEAVNQSYRAVSQPSSGQVHVFSDSQHLHDLRWSQVFSALVLPASGFLPSKWGPQVCTLIQMFLSDNLGLKSMSKFKAFHCLITEQFVTLIVISRSWLGTELA